MKFAHGLVLVLVGLSSYFVLALRFGVYQRFPVAHILLAASGIIIMTMRMKKDFSFLKLSGMLLSTALLAIFLWWSQGYSTYRKSAVVLNNSEEDLWVKSAEGEDFHFNAALKKSRRTLLVFNRGVW